jgi:hypothetical protein
MQMTESSLATIFAARIREARNEMNGMLARTHEIGRRMFQNLILTDMICPRCLADKVSRRTQKHRVFCCATTTDPSASSVLYFCAHVCGKHGVVEHIVEDFWQGEHQQEHPRCPFCSRSIDPPPAAA